MKICLLGLGEVGRILGEDLQASGHHILSAFDTLFDNENSIPSRNARELRIEKPGSLAEAVANADLVISAVTAHQAVSAARETANKCAPGAFFLDLNSTAPNSKKAAADNFLSTRARYVEATVMSPIQPKRIASPILLCGAHAQEFFLVAQSLGFTGASFFSDQLGSAAAAKLCRSVIVKGLEALLAESLITARFYGVEETVLASLSDLFPAADWKSLSKYMLIRSVIHGKRRAEEMREAAAMVRDGGLEPLLATATASRQAWAAARIDPSLPDLTHLLDAFRVSVAHDMDRSSC